MSDWETRLIDYGCPDVRASGLSAGVCLPLPKMAPKQTTCAIKYPRISQRTVPDSSTRLQEAWNPATGTHCLLTSPSCIGGQPSTVVIKR